MTNDLSRRLNEHDVGKESTPSTMNRGPFVLVHAEECTNTNQARLREKFCKSGVGREIRDKLFNTWWV